MAVRDRLVAAVLAAGVLLGMAAWRVVTPWLGIAVVIAAVVTACVVYRLDGRRHDRIDDDVEDDGEPEVSTPRRAAGRP